MGAVLSLLERTLAHTEGGISAIAFPICEFTHIQWQPSDPSLSTHHVRGRAEAPGDLIHHLTAESWDFASFSPAALPCQRIRH